MRISFPLIKLNVNPGRSLPDTIEMTTDSLHIIVLILSILIAMFLLYFLLSSKKHKEHGSEEKPGPEAEKRRGKPCPLCGELLSAGERVHSVIYPGKPDKLMEIFGCPHCETEPQARKAGPNKRKCPVCKQTMAADSVLIARVFDKPGKTHVHVLGCSDCYSGRTRIIK